MFVEWAEFGSLQLGNYALCFDQNLSFRDECLSYLQKKFVSFFFETSLGPITFRLFSVTGVVSFSGIRVLPSLNSKHLIHCSLFIQLSSDCRQTYSGKGRLSWLTLLCLNLLFHFFLPLPLFASSASSKEGAGRHLRKNRFFNLVFFVLLYLVLFVVLSWLLLPGHCAVGFFAEPLKAASVLHLIMTVTLSACPLGML